MQTNKETKGYVRSYPLLPMNKILLTVAVLLLVACALQTVNEQNKIRIVRDNYGTAHVYADTVYDLFYGYGYAVAQDRLFQMEMARRSTQGQVADVLGPDFLEFDIQTRHLFSARSISAQLEALNQQDRDVFRGYASGMNAWITKVKAAPDTLLPREFSAFEFEPAKWSDYDVAMVFVGTMANRFGDFNTELDNALMLSQLREQHEPQTAAAIFNDLNPRITENAPTTISADDWQPQYSPMELPEVAFTKGSTTRHDIAMGTAFSNCFVLGPGKSEGASAILINGPQFGWYVPAYLYSIGLHGAGFNIVGNTPFAYPVILFGHNADIAWGSTWGAGDIVDVYRLRLNPDNPEQYWYHGEYRDFATWESTITVRSAADQTITIRRSVHGQVIKYQPDANTAYSKRRVWDGKELQSLLAWMHSGRAQNVEQWLEYAEQTALNINWYYADREGDIGYAFVGHYPQRAAGHDNRLPANGDGSQEWQGQKPFDDNPHRINPQSGYLANWNNKPAPGVLNPDEFWYSWSSADRVDYLHSVLDGDKRFSPEQAWDVIENSSYADINARYFLPLIAAAAAASDDTELREINRFMQAWDRHSRDRDRDGYYDQAQTLIFRAFLQRLLKNVLADDLGKSFAYFSETGYPMPGKPTASGTNISTGIKTLYEALQGRTSHDFLNGENANPVIATTLKEVMAKLEAEQGQDYRQWRQANAPRPFSHRNFLGVPQTLESEAMIAPMEQNRGTENNMVVLNSNRIEAWEVIPPGQSGFVSPQGKRDQHYADQFELYNQFERKRIWFYPEDVEANAASVSYISTVRE